MSKTDDDDVDDLLGAKNEGKENEKINNKYCNKILNCNFNFDHNLTMVSCHAYVPAFNNSALGLNNSIWILKVNIAFDNLKT